MDGPSTSRRIWDPSRGYFRMPQQQAQKLREEWLKLNQLWFMNKLSWTLMNAFFIKFPQCASRLGIARKTGIWQLLCWLDIYGSTRCAEQARINEDQIIFLFPGWPEIEDMLVFLQRPDHNGCNRREFDPVRRVSDRYLYNSFPRPQTHQQASQISRQMETWPNSSTVSLTAPDITSFDWR